MEMVIFSSSPRKRGTKREGSKLSGESPRAYPELVWNDITYKALTLTLSQRERGLCFVLTKSGYALTCVASTAHSPSEGFGKGTRNSGFRFNDLCSVFGNLCLHFLFLSKSLRSAFLCFRSRHTSICLRLIRLKPSTNVLPNVNVSDVN